MTSREDNHMKQFHIPMVVGLTACLTALAACGGGNSASGGKASGTGDEIVIAAVLPSTGALLEVANDMYNGWQLAVDGVNAKGGVAGHKFKLIRKDTDTTAPNTVRGVSQAVAEDHASIVTVQTSTEVAAVNQQLAGLNALMFNVNGQEDSLIKQGCNANAFQIVQRTGMIFEALSRELKNLPGKRWAVMAADITSGHSADASFKAAAAAAGKTVVSDQFAPIGTSDFAPYITKIKDSGADAAFVVEYGADGVAYINQAAQFNLSSQVQTTLGLNLLTERSLKVLGDKVQGYYASLQYDVKADNPQNQAFVKSFTQKNGEPPTQYAANAYLGAQTLFAGVQKANSSDPTKIRKALEDLKFDSIDGSLTMRGKDHQLLSPVYVAKVVSEDGGLGFKTLSTAPGQDTAPAPSPDCHM
jgi:ABC-type branched-subunit amino acid transport system substrate-binding protein